MIERLTPALLALLGCSACVQHRATIQPAADAPPADLIAVRGAEPGLDQALVQRDPLPLELRASAVRRDQAGRLHRDEIALRTPLPWWQRFPVDLVTDLLVPRAFIVDARVTIATRVVEPIPAETLLRLAREHGYAGGDDPAAPED